MGPTGSNLELGLVGLGLARGIVGALARRGDLVQLRARLALRGRRLATFAGRHGVNVSDLLC